MKILREDTAAVVVDIQERLFPHIQDHTQLGKNCRILLQGLKALEIPVLVTEQYSKGLGPTISEISDLLGETKKVEKMSFSCCGSEQFKAALNNTGKRTVIVFGIESHVCVLQTVLDLKLDGYRPVVVEDCVGSRKMNDKVQAIFRMRQEGAVITTCESVLFELCSIAGTDEFREISKLVK